MHNILPAKPLVTRFENKQKQISRFRPRRQLVAPPSRCASRLWWNGCWAPPPCHGWLRAHCSDERTRSELDWDDARISPAASHGRGQRKATAAGQRANAMNSEVILFERREMQLRVPISWQIRRKCGFGTMNECLRKRF